MQGIQRKAFQLSLLLVGGSALLFAAIYSLEQEENGNMTPRERYEAFLAEHSGQTGSLPAEGKQPEDPGPAVQQNFLATMDPSLNRPTPEVIPDVLDRIDSMNSGRSPGEAAVPWVERGPSDVGGRTRAIMFDPNDPQNKKVWAGGVSGGLWYNNDITSVDSAWKPVNDFWDNLAITCIAFDPNDPQTFYVGTGEDFYAGSSRGAGIWKSTDGGQSWTQLSSTSDFYYVNDLIVRNESGNSVVYVAVGGADYMGVYHTANEGLQRSTDGGSSWSQVLPNAPNGNPYCPADLELASDNRIWLGTKENTFSGSDVEDRGGGRIFWSDDGTTWSGNVHNPAPTNSRVEVATAPSNANYVYGIMGGSNRTDVDHMLYTDDKGSNWYSMNQPDDADNGIPSNDFSRGQAFYDLIIKVDPNDPQTIYAGAINLHKSTDKGTSWTQISKWSNNPNMDQLSCSFVHADQHEIVFRNGNSNEAVFGTDGGVFYTGSLGSAASSDVIDPRNKHYNVTQFYSCAIHPDSATNEYLAGSQDNGTRRFTQAGFASASELYGGDGAYCFIDQDQPQYQIVSYVYNRYYLSTDGGNSISSVLIDKSTGNFINAAGYDDSANVLYTAKDGNHIYRVRNVTSSPSLDSISLSLGSSASAFEASPFTNSSSTIFIGTEAGRLFKVTDAASASPSSTEITGSSFPTGNISSIQLGTNENELLVTFSNYGVTSVWYSNDGGSTWSAKEGNLSNIPVRWALFNPNDYNRVVLATEVGVWRTNDLSAASPSWTASNSGLAKVRVDMLKKRGSDDQVIAGTYGRGLFSSSFKAPCTAPSSQPTSLVLNAVSGSQIDGYFDSTGTNADAYLVVRSTSSSLSNGPSDGTSYSSGDALGGGTVVQASSDTSFSATGLSNGTTYYFFVYAYDDQNCINGPAYNSNSPLTGNESTWPACTDPSDQPGPLTLNVIGPSQIDGHYDTANSADGYLLVRSTNNSLSSSPSDGTTYTSGDALGGGTVIQASPDTSFSATGLNGGTEYHFFVYAYNDSLCTGGPAYNTTGALQDSATTPYPPCSAPSSQASSLVLQAVSDSQIEGHFDTASSGADAYLIVRSTNSSLSASPNNGTQYSSGDALGGGTVVQSASDTSFLASGLNSNTTYYFFVFAYNDSACSGGPAYNTNNPLQGNATTWGPCTTPSSQPGPLVLNAVSSTQIDGHFDTATSGATEYLIVRNDIDSLTGDPTDGSNYSSGDALGGGTVVQSSTDTSFSASGLTPNRLYYFFIFAYNDSACTGGPIYKTTDPLLGYEATLRTDGRCPAIGDPTSQEHIRRVRIDSLDKSSGVASNGFEDHSNLSTVLQRAKSYTLKVNIDTDGDSTDHVLAWIDWNQDNDFQDANEIYDLGQATNDSSALLTQTIPVPVAASLGDARMRIVQAFGSDPSPCDLAFEGEVEEYNLHIDENTALQGGGKELSWQLYPNPNQGRFKLEVANEDRKPLEVNVFGPKGDRVYHRSFGKKPLSRTIELDKGLPAGSYLLQLRVGENSSTRTFLIEKP